MRQPDCPFCSVHVNGRRILAERNYTVVILSNPRLMVGHTLVLPKRHVAALSELIEAERIEIFETAISFLEKLKRINPGGGCDLSQHDRPFMPTTRLTVPGHLHIHLKPRAWQDEYYTRVLMDETDMFSELTREEAERLHELLAE